MICRHCGTDITQIFLDLGAAPASNAYLSAEDLKAPETYLPLRLRVCHRCWLVQTEDYFRAEDLFRSDYAYFSSTSSSWLAHAADYARLVTQRFDLAPSSFVVEIASNDGYLLRNFVESGIDCLGIEPTAGTAAAAERLGIPVLREFFGDQLARRLAAEGRKADLIIGNNVYAHVPDINDFTRGLCSLLKPTGVITLEFPHLLQLIDKHQFDTVYHEHFSYLSLHTVSRVFQAAGLRVWDIDELETHGGSLRVYACHMDDEREESVQVQRVLNGEERFGLLNLDTYKGFQAKANRVKDDLVEFLIQSKRRGKKVAAYGAAAKGNTLLNYGGIKPDLIPFVCDAAPAKQGKFLPGSRIPIYPPEALRQFKPAYVLILPWNISAEISKNLEYVKSWGGNFVTSVPGLKVDV
jgi:SAM-dependent methyltransferase